MRAGDDLATRRAASERSRDEELRQLRAAVAGIHEVLRHPRQQLRTEQDRIDAILVLLETIDPECRPWVA